MTTRRYAEAGVDIEAGDRLKNRIVEMARSTFSPAVLHRDGAFGGLFALGGFSMRKPVLVSSVDGVGTKVKVAIAVGRHKGIGADLVNHCVNDILTCGARPLFFLDYFACHCLEDRLLLDLVEGMSEACQQSKMALIGGETAQMPDIYSPGEYDLAGTIIGMVDEDEIIDGKNIQPGDALIGLPSSGLHTNGFTLARRALLDIAELDLNEPATGLNVPLGEALLVPHRCYLKELETARAKAPIKGVVHITGGGFEGNIGRILPEGCKAVVEKNAWDTPAIFTLIQAKGDVSEEEMYRVFNMGIGLVVIVSEADVDSVLSGLPEGLPIGRIQTGEGVEMRG